MSLQLLHSRIGSPEGVVLEDEVGTEVLTVFGKAAAGRVYDRGGREFNIASFKRAGSSWSLAWEEAVAEAKAAGMAGYQAGVICVPPMNDAMVVEAPIVLPRSGTTPTGVVHVVGTHPLSARIRGSDASFPAGRALIEWEPVMARTLHQRITNLLLHPAAKDGCRAIHYALMDPADTSPVPLERLQIDLSRVIFEGSNRYMPDCVRLEGDVLHSVFEDLYGNVSRAPAGASASYDTVLLHFDSAPAGSVLSNETKGLHFSDVARIQAGVRKGGFMRALKGRLMRSSVCNAICDGSLDGPAYDLVDCYSSTLSNVSSEGRGEKPQMRITDSIGLTVVDLAMGVPNADTRPDGTSSGVGNGLELLNVRRSRFINRPTVAGSVAFSTAGSKLLVVDGACEELEVLGWEVKAVAGAVASEIEIGAAALTSSYFEFFDVDTKVWSYRGVRRMGPRKVAHGPWSPSVTAGGHASINVGVAGAEVGMQVTATGNQPLGVGKYLTAEVTASGNVQVTLHNRTGTTAAVTDLYVTIRCQP